MKKNLTVANLITIFRIILVPIFMVFYLNESLYYEGFPLYGVLIFLLAFFSDILDGVIARSTNTITNIGKVLDPLADKLLRVSVILCFYIKGVLPLYVFIILLTFDLIAVIIGTILYSQKIVVKSNIYGKITTVFMSVALFLCFYHNTIKPYDLILVMIAIVMVILTFIQYFIKYYRIFKKSK